MSENSRNSPCDIQSIVHSRDATRVSYKSAVTLEGGDSKCDPVHHVFVCICIHIFE